MQVNDFKNIQEAIKYEVLQDENEYLKLLKVIGNNQKYDFSSQLSIYNKEPEARACATFDMWKKYFGRVVMRGQKGIPILVGSDVNKKFHTFLILVRPHQWIGILMRLAYGSLTTKTITRL